MAAKKQFVVFGLGRFGGTMVKEFAKRDVEVLAVDVDMDVVQEYMKYATKAVQMSGIDESALEALGVQNFDHAFVSYGDNVQNSILTSLILKEMGVPKVWAKASNDYHQRVLEKIGVDKVIHPERDMAKRVVNHVVSDRLVDIFELSSTHSIVEFQASSKIAGKTVVDLNVRARYNCNIVAFQVGDDVIIPDSNYIICEDDVVIVVGKNEDLARFEKEGI